MSTEIVAFKEFELGLVTLEESNADMEFDMTTPEGIDKCRKWYRTLRKGTNALDKIRKETGADYLRLKREVDAEAKTIQVRLDVMEMPHKIALDDIEAAEQAEIDRIAAEAEAKVAKEEADRIKTLEEREKKAQAIIDAAEAKQAKADRIERDKRIAEDAAANARREEEDKRIIEEGRQKAQAKLAAETAEREKKEALAKAEKEKKDAILEVQRKAHEAKGKLAAKQLKEKTDAQAVIDEADKVEAERVADVEHRKEVEGDIHHDMTMVVTPIEEFDDVVPAIITAIKSGLIPHVTINY